MRIYETPQDVESYGYTDIHLPGGSSVRIIHNHRLSLEQRNAIRETIFSAKRMSGFSNAVMQAPSTHLEQNEKALLQTHFQSQDRGDKSDRLASAARLLKQTDAALNHSRLQIKITSSFLPEHENHIGLVKQDVAGQTLGKYRRDFPDGSRAPVTELRMTLASLCSKEHGRELVINSAAVKSAKLQKFAYRQDKLHPDDISEYPKFTGDPRYREALATAKACASFSTALHNAAVKREENAHSVAKPDNLKNNERTRTRTRNGGR